MSPCWQESVLKYFYEKTLSSAENLVPISSSLSRRRKNHWLLSYIENDILLCCKCLLTSRKQNIWFSTRWAKSKNMSDLRLPAKFCLKTLYQCFTNHQMKEKWTFLWTKMWKCMPKDLLLLLIWKLAWNEDSAHIHYIKCVSYQNVCYLKITIITKNHPTKTKMPKMKLLCNCLRLSVLLY